MSWWPFYQRMLECYCCLLYPYIWLLMSVLCFFIYIMSQMPLHLQNTNWKIVMYQWKHYCKLPFLYRCLVICFQFISELIKCGNVSSAFPPQYILFVYMSWWTSLYNTSRIFLKKHREMFNCVTFRALLGNHDITDRLLPKLLSLIFYSRTCMFKFFVLISK